MKAKNLIYRSRGTERLGSLTLTTAARVEAKWDSGMATRTKPTISGGITVSCSGPGVALMAPVHVVAMTDSLCAVTGSENDTGSRTRVRPFTKVKGLGNLVLGSTI